MLGDINVDILYMCSLYAFIFSFNGVIICRNHFPSEMNNDLRKINSSILQCYNCMAQYYVNALNGFLLIHLFIQDIFIKLLRGPDAVFSTRLCNIK